MLCIEQEGIALEVRVRPVLHFREKSSGQERGRGNVSGFPGKGAGAGRG